MASAYTTVLTVFVVNQIYDARSDVIVTLKDGGRVQGMAMTSEDGSEYYSFRGIPYAESPEGPLRFKPPVPKDPRPGKLYDATHDGPVCAQMDSEKQGLLSGKEDCLRINVYTWKIPKQDDSDGKSNNSAVLVFIHGGGFMGGGATSNRIGPKFFMDFDVVFVTFNYRLDAFGFLSTADEASPGNYGMLDQILALHWIQDNIEFFGGDKHRVTIFGVSAGGASVSFHLFSPLSAGLFHGAVSMSGSATCSWVLKQDQLYWAKRLAKDVGCPTNSSQELVECLRTVPAQHIVSVTPNYMSTGVFPLPFTPTVDGHFLPDYPAKLLKSPNKLNRVPVISGIVEKEGVSLTSKIFTDNLNETLSDDAFLTRIIGGIFGTHKPVQEITDIITKFYFESIDRNNLNQVREVFYNVSSDGLINMAHYEIVSSLAQAGFTIYAYSYEYKMSNFSFASISGIKGDWGVSHGDDIPILFEMGVPIVYSQRDKAMSHKLINMYTNFAKYGTPLPRTEENFPDWPVSAGNTLSIYHINESITVTNYNPTTDPKYKFWNVDVRTARDRAYNASSNDEL